MVDLDIVPEIARYFHSHLRCTNISAFLVPLQRRENKWRCTVRCPVAAPAMFDRINESRKPSKTRQGNILSKDSPPQIGNIGPIPEWFASQHEEYRHWAWLKIYSVTYKIVKFGGTFLPKIFLTFHCTCQWMLNILYTSPWYSYDKWGNYHSYLQSLMIQENYHI